MVEVDIITSEYDEKTDEVRSHVRATLHVEGNKLTFSGDEDYAHFEDVTVLHPEKVRHQLRLETDGEEWARYLPTAFRGGQLTARVTRDTAVANTRPAKRGRRRKPALA